MKQSRSNTLYKKLKKKKILVPVPLVFPKATSISWCQLVLS